MVLKISTPISTIEVVGISEHDVARVNSVSKRYKEERSESKAPTFALT
jgi:phage FluMu protein gp41